MYHRLALPVRNLLYSSLALILCLYLSWHALLGVNFSYGFWHDTIGIAENITEYAPQNSYRKDFADTSKAERVDLFKQICEAISHQGTGLKDIYYTAKTGLQTPLLHRAEIIHLQDVANLIAFTQKIEPFLAFAWLLLLVVFLRCKWPLPSYKQLILSYTGLFCIIGVAILLYGWVDIFYAGHRWIFPDDHQWFFYYQESLMSTMMKAPDLFLYIGISMMTLACIFLFIIHGALQFLVGHLKSQN
jgi:uncharacterized membrane protein